jgi:predicted acyltransferase (DUF342 family)
MFLLISNLLLSVIFMGINPTVAIALTMTNNDPGNNTVFGGLSAESVDIAEANKTELNKNVTDDNVRFGGLSAESVDIAEANKTDVIRNATNNSNTDFGGLSARSVNITN